MKQFPCLASNPVREPVKETLASLRSREDYQGKAYAHKEVFRKV